MSHFQKLNTPMLFVAALLAIRPELALADLAASVRPYPAQQIGMTPEIKIGTLTSARTSLNSIWARVAYRVECSEPNIQPPLEGSLAGSNNSLLGPRNIDVTAPPFFPSTMTLPGFTSIPNGGTFDCVHFFTGEARSNVLPFGAGGATFPIGGDAWQESGFLTFTVIKPGTEYGGGCRF
jgi:hypothetical protein